MRIVGVPTHNSIGIRLHNKISLNSLVILNKNPVSLTRQIKSYAHDTTISYITQMTKIKQDKYTMDPG